MAAITAFFEFILTKILTFFIGLLVAVPVPIHIYDAPEGATYDVKVMSYNVYVAGAGETSPENRTELVVKTIRSEMPDSFGLQEADWGWMSRISEALPEYAYVGVGRDDGEQGGEFSPVFYLKDKYNLVDSGTFWLSKTPEKPSRGWDAMLKRICSYAVLEDKETGRRYAHYNAHFDHIGKNARANSAQLIVEKTAGYEIPVVLTGDFNCDEGTAPYNTIVSGGFADTKYMAKDTMDIGSFHNFGVNDVYDGRSPIDFIFVTAGKGYAKNYRVLDQKVDGKYSSDHFPVVSEIQLCCGEELTEQLRVMSYNLRFSDPLKRLTGVTGVINQVSPDVLGTQEATPEWMEYLGIAYGGVYGVIGVGRDDGANEGEHAAIFYRKDKLKVVDSGTFWLSETPDVPSGSWDTACWRICTWAVFERLSDGKQFVHLNTHLDHVSEEAQLHQAAMVIEKAKSFDVPVVITGDMNVTPDSSVYSAYTAEFDDTRAKAPVTDDYPTYNGFDETRAKEDMSLIDYCFSKGFTAQRFDVVEGNYSSDHFAIWADLSFETAAK